MTDRLTRALEELEEAQAELEEVNECGDLESRLAAAIAVEEAEEALSRARAEEAAS